jgi:phosphoribosylaminoimidazolecarboxamide formyltransferase/IMP cyclohydrolase
MAQFRRALISVSDKTGLVDFLKPHMKTLSIISTGGTFKLLKSEGFNVTEVEQLTGFPEVMDGRVKTLHPRVYMPILGRLHEKEDVELLKKEKLEPFDLVIVNLYPFEATLEKNAPMAEMIENIDIGGPSMIRASAKNFERIAIVCDPSDYARLNETKELTPEIRRELAAKAFFHVSSYDAMIGNYLNPEPNREYSVGGALVQKLRYGENPHQSAFWYRTKGRKIGWDQAQILQGKELSYNNILDLEAAVGCVADFEEPACVIVKHLTPCGVAIDDSAENSFKKAFEADPISAFGGIVALNRPVSAELATKLVGPFLECVIAPGISNDARGILAQKKNLRVLVHKSLGRPPVHLSEDHDLEVRSLRGGFLIQTSDSADSWPTDKSWRFIGPEPSKSVQSDLIFAQKVVTNVLSDKDIETRGILLCGSGQGMCMAANRFKGIRACLGYDRESVRAARNDDDSNVLCLPANALEKGELKVIVETWLNTPFANASRFRRRIKELDEL